MRLSVLADSSSGRRSLPGGHREEVVVDSARQSHAYRKGNLQLAAQLAHFAEHLIVLIPSRHVIESQPPDFSGFRRLQDFFETGMWMAPVRFLQPLVHL